MSNKRIDPDKPRTLTRAPTPDGPFRNGSGHSIYCPACGKQWPLRKASAYRRHYAERHAPPR